MSEWRPACERLQGRAPVQCVGARLQVRQKEGGAGMAGVGQIMGTSMAHITLYMTVRGGIISQVLEVGTQGL